MNESSLRRRLQQLLLVSTLVLLIIGAAGVLAVRQLTRAQDRLVRQVQVARVASKDIQVGLLDQETGVRGYVVSGDDTFLDPYRAGIELRQAATMEVEESLPGDSRVATLLAQLDEQVVAWRLEVAEAAIDLVAAGEAARARDVLQTVGRPMFDEVRATLAEIDDLLDQRRQSAVDRTESARAELAVVGLTATGLVVLLGVIISVALRRSVLAPLQALRDDATVVASGHFEREVDPVGPEEIRDLALAIESMRQRITDELAIVEQARTALLEGSEELERSNRDLEQFAYVASHDLQEPLRKVAGFCQLLQRRYADQLDERANEYIDYAVDGAERMQELISDLLAFSRIGRTTDSFEAIDLDEVVDAAWRDVRDDDGELVVPGDLPTVAGDRALLRTLFVNLLGNALKFRGDDTPRIQVEANRQGELWDISVRDNGIGIDSEFGDRIFEIFQRLHTRDVYEGTGIGLALCKRIAEFHGGGIRLGPSDQGAHFIVALPVVADPADIGPPPEPLIPKLTQGALQ